MKLTSTQFCRVAPFILGLRMLNDSLGVPSDRDKQGKEARPQGKQWDSILKGIQNLTVERSNQLAVEYGVSFPDETKRESVPFLMADPPFGNEFEDQDQEREPTAEELAELADIAA